MRESGRIRIEAARGKLARVTSSDTPLRTSSRIVTSILRSRIRVADISQPVVPYGECAIKADLRTSLGLRLYRYGSLTDDVRAVLSVLNRGDCFIDGGANVGLFTLPAAATVGPEGAVFAVEPGKVAAQLKTNIALNGLTNVRVVQAALDTQDGGLRAFRDLDAQSAGLSSFTPDSVSSDRSTMVRTCTLDSIAEDTAALVRVVKLDLEGAEVHALRGAERLLTEMRPIFVVEVEDAHLRRQGSTVDELLQMFATSGYRRVDDMVCAPNMWFEPRP